MIARLAAQVLAPASFFFLLIFAALALARKNRLRAARAVAIFAFVFFWLSSTPFVAVALAGRFERHFPPVAVEESPVAEAIVVLGGAAGSRVPPRLDVELVDASDRILHAARLFRAGKAPVIIASGGRAPWSSTEPESGEIARLLVEWGVPRGAILEESASTNTRENALGTARLLGERRIGRVLLVTSAMHMPRALATFRAVGVDAIPSPCDFSAAGGRVTLLDFVPDAGALQRTSGAVREFLGLAFYRARGWI